MRAAVLLVLLSGCVLLPADDDDDDGLECDDLPTRALRDPENGICTTVGHVGAGCKACGNCAPDAVDIIMDRADCGTSSRCDRLTEASCLQEPGCRTVYTLEDDRFLGCWGTAPTEVVSDGTCAGLDADACSHHTNCSAWYAANGVWIAFDHCGDAPSRASCEFASCEPGTHCVQECPPCDASGGASCSAECHAACAPDQGCDALACGLGTVCGESCLTFALHDPPQCTLSCQSFAAGSHGLCDGPITCAASPPACPAGTIAGRADGCYTGYCLPADQCPQLPCDALVTEPACAARPDCRAVDLGGSCTCNATGCTCTLLSFGRCESAAPPGPGG